MRYKYLQRGGILIGLSLFLLSSYLLQFPQTTNAAPSGSSEWINLSVIKASFRFSGNNDLTDQARTLGASEVNRLLGGTIEFKDSNIEDTKREWLGPQKANCGDTGRSKIEANPAETASGEGLTVTDLYINSDRVGCIKVNRSNIKINPSNKSNRNILFNWVNKDTMRRVDGRGGDYKKSSEKTRGGRTIYASSEAPGSQGCKVRVELKQNPRGPYTEGEYNICNANGAEGGASNWGTQKRNVLIGNFAAYSENADADGDGTDAPPTCESQNDNILIGWLLCQVLSAIDDGVTKLLKTVDELLYVSDTAFENDQLQDVWSFFRVLATFLLVAIGLVMVISQAISVGPFDAYTVKKVFPRLVIGVIGIQLSWYLFTILIQLVNAIAWGIEGLMYAPFGGATNFSVESILGGQAGLFVTGTGGALVAAWAGLGLLGLLSLGLTALIGVFIAFALLSARRFILVGLLVVAPIALVAWILPNTEKFWKIWWESFSKLLMMYPLVLFIVATGRIFAYIVSGADTASSNSPGLAESAVGDPILLLMLIAGLFGPFYLIPKTFQLAGSAFANIAGITNNSSRGAFDRLKNFRQNRAQQIHQDRMAAKSRFGGSRAGGLYRRVASGGANGSWSPTRGGRQKWSQQEQLIKDRAATEMLEKGGERAFNDDDASALLRDTSMTKTRFVQEYMNMGHTRDEAYRALSRAELATGARVGSDAMAVAAQRFRVSMTNTAYDPGQAGLDVMQQELQDMVARGLVTEYDAAGWMKANRGRAEFSKNSFGNTVNFVRGQDDNGTAYTSAEQIAGAFHGSDPRDIMGSHQRTVETFAEQAQINLSDALASGDQRVIDKAMADVANIHSMLSNVSPQKAEEWANNVFSQPTGIQLTRQVRDAQNNVVEESYNASVRQYIDVLRSDERNHPDYHDRVREYASARDAATAGAATDGAIPPPDIEHP